MSAPVSPQKLAPLLIAGCCLAYLPALTDATWVHDDHPAILLNDNVRWPPPIASIFTTSYFGPGKEFAHMPLSRPLVTLSFCVEEALGLGVTARKLVHWLLYIGTCLAVWQALLAWLLRLGWMPAAARSAAVGTAALFALHPVHVGVVMSNAYRTEILALLWVLLGSWALFTGRGLGRWRVGLVAGCLGLGLLCKESAVCALAPWALTALAIKDKRLSGALGASLAVALLFLGWRAVALGGVTVGQVPMMDNPLAHVAAGERVIAAFSLVSLAAQHLAWPVGLAPDYSFDALQLPAGWTIVASLGVGIVVACIAAVAWGWRRNQAAAVAVTWAAAFWAPASNLLFAIPVLFADRLLFAPSVAACALVAGGAVTAADRWGKPALSWAPVAALSLVALLATVGATFHWTDDTALYRHGVIAQPRSVKMQLNYGLDRLRAGQPSKAIRHLQRADDLAPHDHDVRTALLTAYAQTRTCDGAKALKARILGEKAAPRAVREALLRWALACGEIPLANELGRGLGLSRRGVLAL